MKKRKDWIFENIMNRERTKITLKEWLKDEINKRKKKAEAGTKGLDIIKEEIERTNE